MLSTRCRDCHVVLWSLIPRLSSVPRPPMRRADGNAFGGFRLGPAAQGPTARKYERVRTIVIGNRDLDVEGCGVDALPHGRYM